MPRMGNSTLAIAKNALPKLCHDAALKIMHSFLRRNWISREHTGYMRADKQQFKPTYPLNYTKPERHE